VTSKASCYGIRVNKGEIIQKIVAQLVAELELLMKAARSAHSEATHESSKAENKYDTRGLEASYLARGQSRQAAEVMQAIAEFEKLDARTFGDGEEIDVGALVLTEAARERGAYFIGPRAGGTEITQDGREILVITPQSPLGQQLVGRKQGEKVKLEIAGARTEFRIASVK
jgi:transcription elongation GreA/GreB family factor